MFNAHNLIYLGNKVVFKHIQIRKCSKSSTELVLHCLQNMFSFIIDLHRPFSNSIGRVLDLVWVKIDLCLNVNNMH